MNHKLRTEHNVQVPRHLVHNVMAELDPEGLEARNLSKKKKKPKRQPSNGLKINRQPSKTEYFYRQPSNERAKLSRQTSQISLNDRDRLIGRFNISQKCMFVLVSLE